MITHILLLLTVVMPADVKDIQHRVEVPTIQECWRMAQIFVDKPVPKIEGALGLAAECAVYSDGDEP